MKIINHKQLIILSLLLAMALSGCKTKGYDNFTTYFNIYYNADRLMRESEEEFDFQQEKKRIDPRVLVPQTKIAALDNADQFAPPQLTSMVVSKATRQAVEVKLDSILIKGSKILAKHPKSNYVEPTLYLMAKTYFYKEEWLPSQIKCSELIDLHPAGEWSPDAHLLMAFSMLLQKKYHAGKIMLSRTVDVAWMKKRYDILTKAFAMEAELALYDNDIEAAVRPYFQAIAQSDDNKTKAIWQNDMAGIFFKMGRFEQAEKAYAKVMKYSPDLVTEYESKLYRASCLIRMGRFDDAESILRKLDTDGKFTEWKGYVMAQRMLATRLQGNADSIAAIEKQADSLYATNNAKLAYYYEKGIDAYRSSDYINARSYVALARNIPYVSTSATKLFSFLNNWEIAQKHVADNKRFLESGSDTLSQGAQDTARVQIANSYFSLARVHYNIGNIDSANYYYKAAADIVPLTQPESARYLYVYSTSVRDTNVWKADSLLDIIVHTQPKTEHGREAMAKLGYTAAFVVDSVVSLYNSGYDLMKYQEYAFAIQQFKDIYYRYPENQMYAPKALYSIGYIFEQKFQEYDSAYHYYQLILEEYPNSIYARELSLPVKYLEAYMSDGEIPDSLKSKEVVLYKANREILTAPIDPNLLSKPVKDDGKFKFEDLKDPKKLLQKAKQGIKETFQEATDLDKLKGKVQETITPAISVPKLEDYIPGEKEKKLETPPIPAADTLNPAKKQE